MGNGISNKNYFVIQSHLSDHFLRLKFLDLDDCRQSVVVYINMTCSWLDVLLNRVCSSPQSDADTGTAQAKAQAHSAVCVADRTYRGVLWSLPRTPLLYQRCSSSSPQSRSA